MSTLFSARVVQGHRVAALQGYGKKGRQQRRTEELNELQLFSSVGGGEANCRANRAQLVAYLSLSRCYSTTCGNIVAT